MTAVGRRAWGVGAWVLLMSSVAALGWSARTPIGAERPTTARDRPRPPLTALNRPYAADSLARATAARPVFRAGRRPASVSYDPARAGQPMVPEVRPPKPVLLLVGVVAGVEPTAVIEGFPGVEGARVVRVGDVIAGLTVKRIADTEVRIAGMDTVWTLTVREPWR